MIQPIKKDKKNINSKVPKKKVTNKVKKKKPHPQYGTSKLEEDFAKQFLDKLGVEYIYQFEAKDIGRFYDFYLPNSNLIIEIDGDYWHGNPNKYDQENLRGHQKRAQRIDEHKTKWALLHGHPIIHIWEEDIRKNPKKVLQELQEKLCLCDKEVKKKNDKKKRH